VIVGYAWLEYVSARRAIPATEIHPLLIPLIERCASKMVTFGNFDYAAHQAVYDGLISEAAIQHDPEKLDARRDLLGECYADLLGAFP
jgi:hypothetical protein